MSLVRCCFGPPGHRRRCRLYVNTQYRDNTSSVKLNFMHRSIGPTIGLAALAVESALANKGEVYHVWLQFESLTHW
jgi:hypothetical protein